MSTTKTLLPRQQAFERHDFKVKTILVFLRTERWSQQDILQKLLKLQSRQAAHKTLTGMKIKGLIKRYSIDHGFGKPMTIWGITPHGVMMSFSETETLVEMRAFERSKLKPTQINHTLDIQRARVRAEAAGWTEWRTAGFAKKGIKSPDAVARRPDGVITAFEIERTLKALRAYPEIMVSHLSARKQKMWDEIYYLMPNDNLKKRVKRCFEVTNSARYKRQTIQITDAHRAPFKFFTYQENWEFPQNQHKETK
jgi:hypothetical protein